MNKWPFFICLLSLVYTSVKAQDNTAILADLNRAVADKASFTKEKEERIESIKYTRNTVSSPAELYRLNRLLYQETQKFKIDLAVHYATENLKIAKNMKRADLLTAAKLDLANVYFPLNKFLEAEQILKSINPKLLSKPELSYYYLTRIQFFEHYITDDDEGIYLDQVHKYEDSLLQVGDPHSLDYKDTRASKYIFSGQLGRAETYLVQLLKTTSSNSADYAMLAYYLGLDFEMQHKNTEAVKYYAASAAADVRLSIKDNAAMQALALLLYATNDIDHAYQYTRSALEDAWFCDSRFRTLHMSKFYAIINMAYLQKEAAGKKQLQSYLILISLLSLFLTVAVIYVYKQMKRESCIKKELDHNTQQLADLNNEITNSNSRLKAANIQLKEANKIKETYIANFFDLCSSYINKLENFRKLISKKASDKNLEELQRMLRSTNIVDSEAEELYKIFDNIFLTLYPTFVFEFNLLLGQKDRISLKHGELLNTELRIYALVRLGITDSNQIAAFLRYSVSTIYNYRTSARNKAVIARDCFEESVMKIGMIG